MRIIVGHSNMDLDCLGSLALARVLFPEYRAVRGRLIHPVARKLYNLYADHLDLASIGELPREPVEKVVIVDTRSRGRLREFDHHPEDSSDIEGAVLHGSAGLAASPSAG